MRAKGKPALTRPSHIIHDINKTKYQNSISKTQLMVASIEYELKGEFVKAAQLNEYIYQLMERESETGVYIASVSFKEVPEGLLLSRR